MCTELIVILAIVFVWTFGTACGSALSLIFIINEYPSLKECIEEYTFRIRRCVVEGKCPIGDTPFHRSMDIVNWWMIQRMKKPGVVMGLWLRGWLGFFLVFPVVQEFRKPVNSSEQQIDNLKESV